MICVSYKVVAVSNSMRVEISRCKYPEPRPNYNSKPKSTLLAIEWSGFTGSDTNAVGLQRTMDLIPFLTDPIITLGKNGLLAIELPGFSHSKDEPEILGDETEKPGLVSVSFEAITLSEEVLDTVFKCLSTGLISGSLTLSSEERRLYLNQDVPVTKISFAKRLFLKQLQIVGVEFTKEKDNYDVPFQTLEYINFSFNRLNDKSLFYLIDKMTLLLRDNAAKKSQDEAFNLSLKTINLYQEGILEKDPDIKVGGFLGAICQYVFASVKSFIATTSISSDRSNMILKTFRPILPKPLIATRVIIKLPS